MPRAPRPFLCALCGSFRSAVRRGTTRRERRATARSGKSGGIASGGLVSLLRNREGEAQPSTGPTGCFYYRSAYLHPALCTGAMNFWMLRDDASLVRRICPARETFSQRLYRRNRLQCGAGEFRREPSRLRAPKKIFKRNLCLLPWSLLS